MDKSEFARSRILITRPITDSGLDLLRQNYTLILNSTGRPLNRAELKRKAKNVNAILCFLNDNIDKEIMDLAGPNLKIISTFSTGYEHIDIEEADKRNIKVGYTGSVLTETTADLAFGLILSAGRRIVEADRLVRDGMWKHGWSPDLMVGTDVYGKTLGIIGMGKIGTAIARRAVGFGMNILYTNRRGSNSILSNNNKISHSKTMKYTDLYDVARESDYIVVCCSLNKDSYHMISHRFIYQMKKSAFLINIARGKIVNQKDLIRALTKKRIAGAALDVYEYEPIQKNNPLIKMKNVVLLPHIGSASIDTRNKMSEIAASNIINVLEGNYEEALLI